MQKASLFLGLFVLAFPAHAAPDLPTIYGIKLGAPLTIPSCVGETEDDPPKPIYRYNQACFTSDLPTMPELIHVQFPANERPALSARGQLGLTVRAEIVQSVHWGTRGVYDVEEIVGALKTKFGPPTKAEKLTFRTPQGGTFDGWNMRWDRQGYVIHYSTQNFARLLDIGNVTIRTIEEERRAVAQSPEVKRPL